MEEFYLLVVKMLSKIYTLDHKNIDVRDIVQKILSVITDL